MEFWSVLEFLRGNLLFKQIIDRRQLDLRYYLLTFKNLLPQNYMNFLFPKLFKFLFWQKLMQTSIFSLFRNRFIIEGESFKMAVLKRTTSIRLIRKQKMFCVESFSKDAFCVHLGTDNAFVGANKLGLAPRCCQRANAARLCLKGGAF